MWISEFLFENKLKYSKIKLKGFINQIADKIDQRNACYFEIDIQMSTQAESTQDEYRNGQFYETIENDSGPPWTITSSTEFI